MLWHHAITSRGGVKKQPSHPIQATETSKASTVHWLKLASLKRDVAAPASKGRHRPLTGLLYGSHPRRDHRLTGMTSEHPRTENNPKEMPNARSESHKITASLRLHSSVTRVSVQFKCLKNVWFYPQTVLRQNWFTLALFWCIWAVAVLATKAVWIANLARVVNNDFRRATQIAKFSFHNQLWLSSLFCSLCSFLLFILPCGCLFPYCFLLLVSFLFSYLFVCCPLVLFVYCGFILCFLWICCCCCHHVCFSCLPCMCLCSLFWNLFKSFWCLICGNVVGLFPVCDSQARCWLRFCFGAVLCFFWRFAETSVKPLFSFLFRLLFKEFWT